MKHLFEDGNWYTVDEAANSELGIVAKTRFYDGITDAWPDYLRFLQQRYFGEPIQLEFGPGRNGEPPYIKRSHPTIGLNPSADPKSDLYWNLENGIPLPDECIHETYGNEFLEHIGGQDRIRFMNDLYHILVPGGLAVFNVPHWQSPFASGDPTHKWPPFTEASFQYFCVTKDGVPFVSGFSDYGITCRFMFDKPQKIIPGVSIHVELRKPK
jgi:hypothetical protein